MPFVSTFAAFSVKGFGGGLSNPLFGGTGMVGTYSGLIIDFDVDSLGNVVGIYDNTQLFKYASDGTLIFWKTVNAGPSDSSPDAIMLGIKIDSSDNIYLTTTNTGVIKLNSSGSYVTCYSFGISLFNTMQFISGSLYLGGGATTSAATVINIPKDSTTGVTTYLKEYAGKPAGQPLTNSSYIDIATNTAYMYSTNSGARFEENLTVSNGTGAGFYYTSPTAFVVNFNGTAYTGVSGTNGVYRYQTNDGLYKSLSAFGGGYYYYGFSKVFGTTSPNGTGFGIRVASPIDNMYMDNMGYPAFKVGDSIYFYTDGGYRQITWTRLENILKIVVNADRICIVAQGSTSPSSGVIFNFPYDGKLMSRGSFVIDGQTVSYIRNNLFSPLGTMTLPSTSSGTGSVVTTTTPTGTSVSILTVASSESITVNNLPE